MRIVLVPGLGVGQRYFDPLARELGGFELVRPDLRRLPSVQAQAASLRPLVRGSLLLGNSMGCQVIAELGPEVERAVFVGPTVDRRSRSWVNQGARLALDMVREPPRLVGIVALDYLRANPLRFAAQARSALRDAIEREIPRLGGPLLVIRGARDPLCPQGWAEEIVRLAPDARLEVVPGAAHAAHWSHPRELAALLRAFVEESA